MSVWQKFIFLNTSEWKIDSVTWDFGDGNTSNIDGDVVHTYSWADRVRTVKLTIREGGKEEVIEKEVVTNIKNILKARKSGVNLFSSPIIEDDIMNVTNESEKITLYPWESNGGETEVKYYAVDYDTEIDSDLNGWKDDDRDNINTSSYTSGAPLTLPLNGNKNQKVRIFTLDASEEIINSYEFSVDKAYIKEEEIDLDSIVFEWVSDAEKEKIEELKSLLTNLPTEKRLLAMKYVQRLQEDWHDPRAKTDTMVEMQLFLAQIPDYDPTQVNELLESFLVNDTADKGERDVSYNALQNLVPQNIECDDAWEFSSCKEMLTAKLEAIKNSTDLDENKRLWWEILDIIWAQWDKVMTNDAKLRFKEVLTPFVYGGVTNVPDDELIEPTNSVDDDSKTSKWLGILKWILYITVGILGLILLWLILFFIFYKLKNKDKNVEFQDFIIEKTSGKSSSKTEVTNDILSDPFNAQDDELANLDFSAAKPEEKKVEKKESTVKLASFDTKNTAKSESIIDPLAWVDVEDNSKKDRQEKIPSWLWNSKKNTTNKKEEKRDFKTENKKVDFSEDIADPLAWVKTDFKAENTKEEKIPSWLAGSKIETKKSEEFPNKDVKEAPKQETEKQIKADTKIETKKENILSKDVDNDFPTPELASASESPKDPGIPDWLSWVNLDTKKEPSSETKKKSETFENTEKVEIIEKIEKTEEKTTTQDAKKTEIKNNNNNKNKEDFLAKKSENTNNIIEEEAIPSWLKGSFWEEKIEEKKDSYSDTKNKENQKEMQSHYQTSKSEDEKSASQNKKQNNSQKSNSVKNSDTPFNKGEEKKKNNTDEKEEKSSANKNLNSKTQDSKNTKKLVQDSDLDDFTKLDDGIPDWLKGSLDNKKKDDAVSESKEADTTNSKNKENQSKKTESQEEKATSDKQSSPKALDKTENKSEEKQDSPKTYSKLKADANVSKGTNKFWEWALWEDGMEIPDWLKWWDDTK
jgi:hypothetical protein